MDAPARGARILGGSPSPLSRKHAGENAVARCARCIVGILAHDARSRVHVYIYVCAHTHTHRSNPRLLSRAFRRSRRSPRGERWPVHGVIPKMTRSLSLDGGFFDELISSIRCAFLNFNLYMMLFIYIIHRSRVRLKSDFKTSRKTRRNIFVARRFEINIHARSREFPGEMTKGIISSGLIAPLEMRRNFGEAPGSHRRRSSRTLIAGAKVGSCRRSGWNVTSPRVCVRHTRSEADSPDDI